MDQADALGLLRDLLKVVGAGLITHGAITQGDYELIAGIVIAAFPIVWSYVARMQAKTAVVKAAVTGVPVQATVTSPISATPTETAIANASPTVQTSLKDKP